MQSVRPIPTGFAHPMDQATALLGHKPSVVSSLRMRPGAVNAWRYYAEMGDVPATRDAAAVRQLLVALRFPAEQLDAAEALLLRLGVLRFVGAAWEDDVLWFRAYLGFANPGKGPGWAEAFDWSPGTRAFKRRSYVEHQQLARAETQRRIAACNGSVVSAMLTALLCRCGDRFAVTEVSEPGLRQSVAVNFAHAPPLQLQGMQAWLGIWTRHWGLPAIEWRNWWLRAREQQLIDLAAGRDGSGQPFLTLYHGWSHAIPS